MKHSTIIFGQDLYNLQYGDIESFFAQQRDETLYLEFKSYVAQGNYSDKEKTIKKSVCALLNSEGGIIIWGAPIENRDSNGNTSATGALTPFTSQLDRDRLINILSSSITPLPIGIRVQVLKDTANNSLFVIEVEKSIERPHQFDNLYYVRLDGQTRVAPHYLISALMKSTDFPVLRGHIRLKKIRYQDDYFFLTFKKLLYNTSFYNNDLHIRMRIIAIPGDILVNNVNHTSDFIQDFPIVSNGAPLMSNFVLRIPSDQIGKRIDILFQFGGEKSPSKVSSYKYQLGNNIADGNVQDETIYVVEKSENKMPSDVTNNSVEDNINLLLNQ